jgi:DNA-binding transcriptional regulator YiaG
MTPLYHLMERCGLSIIGLARLLGCGYDTVKKWRTGKRNCPQRVIDQLERLVEAQESIFNNREQNDK